MDEMNLWLISGWSRIQLNVINGTNQTLFYLKF